MCALRAQNTIAGTILGLIFIVMIFGFPTAYKAVLVMRARGQIPTAREAWEATKARARGCKRNSAATGGKAHATQNPLGTELTPGGGRAPPPPMQ